MFAVSLGLVVRYMLTGRGYEIATLSILVKTIALLYAIMITGSIWEKEVFGQVAVRQERSSGKTFSACSCWGYRPPTSARCSLPAGVSPRQQMMIAIAAYAAYMINATQFLLKLRAARIEAHGQSTVPAGAVGGAL